MHRTAVFSREYSKFVPTAILSSSVFHHDKCEICPDLGSQIIGESKPLDHCFVASFRMPLLRDLFPVAVASKFFTNGEIPFHPERVKDVQISL